MLVVITKLDICPENILKTTRRTLAKLLRDSGKMPYPVKDLDAGKIYIYIYIYIILIFCFEILIVYSFLFLFYLINI
jgi:GTPase